MLGPLVLPGLQGLGEPGAVQAARSAEAARRLGAPVTDIPLSPGDAAWELLTAMAGPGTEDRYAADCRRLGLGDGPRPMEVALTAIMQGMHLTGYEARIRERLCPALASVLELDWIETVTAALMKDVLGRIRKDRVRDPPGFAYFLILWARSEALKQNLELYGVAEDDSGSEPDLALYCVRRWADSVRLELVDAGGNVWRSGGSE